MIVTKDEWTGIEEIILRGSISAVASETITIDDFVGGQEEATELVKHLQCWLDTGSLQPVYDPPF